MFPLSLMCFKKNHVEAYLLLLYFITENRRHPQASKHLTFLFQFPTLCNQYYKLITFICEIFPEKIPQLPEDLFKSLMYSLELGMTSYPLNGHRCHLSLG